MTLSSRTFRKPRLNPALSGVFTAQKWWGQIAQVLTIYKEDIREKLYYAIIET